MAIDELEFEKVWTDSDDFPTYEGSEEQVRADMQYHPDAIRDYINNVLLPALYAETAAGNIGDEQEGNVAATMAALLRRIEKNDKAIVDLAAGDAPEAVKSAICEFGETDWAEDLVDGYWELAISKEEHKRSSAAFGYRLESAVGENSYKTGTWNAHSTAVRYIEASGEIRLVAPEAYRGRITFFGV